MIDYDAELDEHDRMFEAMSEETDLRLDDHVPVESFWQSLAGLVGLAIGVLGLGAVIFGLVSR